VESQLVLRLVLAHLASEIGSEAEIAMLRRVGRLFTAATVMHCPLTSLMRIVIGQMISIASPREPAKTASVPLAVGNGQERTARVGDPFGTSIRKAIWLTRPLSQRLARRASAGRSLENVDAMRRAWVGSAAYAFAKLLSFASLAAWWARSRRVGSIVGSGTVGLRVNMVNLDFWMLWRLGRIAEITFLWGFFAAIVVEVGLVHTFVCLECRDWCRSLLCVWGSNNASGFQFLYRATRDCDFKVCWILVGFGIA
jgi:hypothetical protein